MAEAAVSLVVEKIGDILLQKAIFLGGVRGQVVRLQTELKRMQCFLKDADTRQQEDERVRNWVSEIRDVAYEAEDIIDVFILDASSRRTNFFPNRILKTLDLYEIGKEIEAIQAKVQDISRSRITYGINNIGEESSSASQRLQKLRRTSPRAEEHEIVGLKEEADKLVEQLIGGDQRRRVISIVGMGGIGKTTLAKKVYNHKEISESFHDCRTWIYVSQDCRPREIFQQIINKVCAPTEEESKKIERMHETDLGDFLRNRLMGKRYLVVLDDIWEIEDWKCLENVFPKESNGSRLLLTTRNKDVALQADAKSPPCEMQLLAQRQSWVLFCRTAIPDNNETESCPPELKELGKKMVEKCAGLPLAIIILGGLLSSKNLPTEWENVLNNIRGHFSRGIGGVDAILSLSYIELSHNLKSCFLFLGLFPEDQVISAKKLILLWVAEGFIPRQDEQRMEDTAEEYLNELINRNLVKMVRMSVSQRVRECQVHDLIRDLSIKKAKEENFFEVPKSTASFTSTSTSLPPSRPRRRGIYSDSKFSLSADSVSYIRSLLFFKLDNRSYKILQLEAICNCFKLLRVLDLDGLEMEWIPSSLGQLIHLRYLRLRSAFSCFKSLPTSVANLWSLQTLDIGQIVQVPNVVWKIENLRHLTLDRLEDDGRLQIDTLRNLQTVSGMTWNEFKQNDSSKLISLRKLRLIGRPDSEGIELSDSISKLENLKSLHIRAYAPQVPSLVMNSWLQLSKLYIRGTVKLPAGDEFPPNLTKLTLEHPKLELDPMAILEKLPKLLILKLRGISYSGEDMQVSENGFPQLRILQISDMLPWKTMNIKKGGMSKLTQIYIYKSQLRMHGFEGLLHLQDICVSSLFVLEPFSEFAHWQWKWREAENGKRMLHFQRR